MVLIIIITIYYEFMQLLIYNIFESQIQIISGSLTFPASIGIKNAIEPSHLLPKPKKVQVFKLLL